jgi:hypothetical protein
MWLQALGLWSCGGLAHSVPSSTPSMRGPHPAAGARIRAPPHRTPTRTSPATALPSVRALGPQPQTPPHPPPGHPLRRPARRRPVRRQRLPEVLAHSVWDGVRAQHLARRGHHLARVKDDHLWRQGRAGRLCGEERMATCVTMHRNSRDRGAGAEAREGPLRELEPPRGGPLRSPCPHRRHPAAPPRYSRGRSGACLRGGGKRAVSTRKSPEQ